MGLQTNQPAEPSELQESRWPTKNQNQKVLNIKIFRPKLSRSLKVEPSIVNNSNWIIYFYINFSVEQEKQIPEGQT